MNLINVTFALLALFLLSSFVGALFSNGKDESFAQTLRRGFTTLLSLAVLAFVVLVMMEEPKFIERVTDFLERILTTY